MPLRVGRRMNWPGSSKKPVKKPSSRARRDEVALNTELRRPQRATEQVQGEHHTCVARLRAASRRSFSRNHCFQTVCLEFLARVHYLPSTCSVAFLSEFLCGLGGSVVFKCFFLPEVWGGSRRRSYPKIPTNQGRIVLRQNSGAIQDGDIPPAAGRTLPLLLPACRSRPD